MINLKELVDNIQNLLSTNNICPCVDENNNIQFILGADFKELKISDKIRIYKTNQKLPRINNTEETLIKALDCVYIALKEFGTKTENYFDTIIEEKDYYNLKFGITKIRTIIKIANIVYNEEISK